MFNLRPFEVRNFNLGITEDFENFDRRAYVVAENLLVEDDDNLITVQGSVIEEAANDRVPGNDRISSLIPEFSGARHFLTSNQSFFYYAPNFTELKGEDGNFALPNGENAQISFKEWKGHLFLTDDGQSPMVKIFRDSGGTLTLVQAGLPKIDNDKDNFDDAQVIVELIARANELKGLVNDHIDLVATSHKIADSNIFLADATDEDTSYALIKEISDKVNFHARDAILGNFVFHTQDDGSNSLLVFSSQYLTGDLPTTVKEGVTLLNRSTREFDAHQIKLLIHNPDGALTDFPGNSNGTINATTGLDDFIPTPITGITIRPTNDSVFEYANQIQQTFKDHINDQGSAADAHDSLDSTNQNNSSLADTLLTFRQLVWDFWLDFILNASDAHAGSAAHGSAETIPPLEPTQATPFNLFGGITWGDIGGALSSLSDFRTKWNLHDNALTPHYSGANDPNTGLGYHNIVPAVPAQATYIYAFHYFREYTVGDITFQDNGPVQLITVTSTSAIGDFTQEIENIPVLTNNSDTNWDLTNIKIKVFRTANAGTDFRLIIKLDNGTTIFSDQTPDTELSAKEQLYTAGDVLQNDVLPIAKFFHEFNNIGYYGNLIDEADGSLPRRIRLSISNDLDGSPASFFIDMKADITGISSTASNVLAFSEKRFERLTGNFTATGAGSLSSETVSSTIGAVNNRGILQVEGGVYFAGRDGIYFTDGFQFQKLTEDLEKFYESLVSTATQKRFVYGAYNEITRRVWWSFRENPDSTDNDICLILDTTKSLRKNSTFTVRRGGNDSFKPTALLFKGKQMLRGDERGYLFLHRDDLRSDPKIDTAVASSTWTTQAIKWRLKSLNIPFGSTLFRKWVPKLNWISRDLGNASIQVESINDNRSDKHSLLKEIRYRIPIWGEPNAVWGGDGSTWFANWRDERSGTIDQWRHFTKGKLRCDYKQVEFRNADTNIAKSDDFSTADIDATTNIITLTRGTSFWPTNPEDYEIAFEGDSFVQKFLITASNANRPSAMTFHHSFSENILNHGVDFSKDFGSQQLSTLTGSPFASGDFDTSLIANSTFADYTLNQIAQPAQLGTLRFAFTPLYAGSPASDQKIIRLSETTGDSNRDLLIIHNSSGDIVITDEDNASGSVLSYTVGAFVSVNGTKVIFEFDWDYTTGAHRFFIDGVQLGATDTSTSTAMAGPSRIQSPHNAAGAGEHNFKIDDITLFDTVQNTVNHSTPQTEFLPDITVSDDDNDLSDLTGQKWVVSGIPKEEKINQLAYILQWAPFGKSQTQFRDDAETTGENA